MVEMLRTAFIMAVGILGLPALQVMALRATRGSRSLSTALLVAGQVLDQVELEGRLSWLNLTASNASSPTLEGLPGYAKLRYITLASGTPRVDNFNLQGRPVVEDSGDPLESLTRFAASTTRTAATAAVTGHLSEFTVQVTFQDEADSAGAAVQRTVRLTRVVSHG